MHSEDKEADRIHSQLDNKIPIRNSEDVIKYKQGKQIKCISLSY